jgi:hypothetical protein
LNPRAREIAKELTNSARKAAKKHTSAADVRNDDVFSPVVVATAENVGQHRCLGHMNQLLLP